VIFIEFRNLDHEDEKSSVNELLFIYLFMKMQTRNFEINILCNTQSMFTASGFGFNLYFPDRFNDDLLHLMSDSCFVGWMLGFGFNLYFPDRFNDDLLHRCFVGWMLDHVSRVETSFVGNYLFGLGHCAENDGNF